MRVCTHLQEIRKKSGFSVADLARRVGVSRQTIYSIEDGSFIPNTAVSLQLARALDVGIEEIFSIADEDEPKPVRAELLAGELSDDRPLVRVCRVDERLIALPISFLPAYLPAADGIIESRTKQTVSIKCSSGLPEQGNRLVLAGCDPALSLLNDALHSPGIDILNVPCSSRRALRWLKQGRVHAAGSHLLDRTTGDYNLPIIRHLLPNVAVRVVTFAIWEQGLVVRRGNPKSIRSIADIAGNKVTLMNREKGAGSRDLLDSALHQLGIPSHELTGYDSVAPGHLAAAYAVASGSADVCVAPRSASRCFGLDFVPLAVERFDIAFSEASFDLPATKAVLDLLTRAHLRKKLQGIAGYDTAHTGDVLI